MCKVARALDAKVGACPGETETRAPAVKNPVMQTRKLLFAVGRACAAGVICVDQSVGQESADWFGHGAQRFSIDFVEIGHPGNAPVGTHPAGVIGGRVGYVYRMGKYEISEAQMRAADSMEGLLLGDVSNLGPNMPATRIGHLQMLRFINWMNLVNGHHIAYNLSPNGDWALWPADVAWQLDGENRFRHKDAFYFLPSWDEWYKAAFYDPEQARFSLYAYGSNTAPLPLSFPGGSEPGTCVYDQPHDLYGMPPPVPGGPTAHRDWQGACEVQRAGGPSVYGTVAQNGNVNEFLETASDGVNDSTSKQLMLRGGWWYRPASVLRQGGGDTVSPSNGHTATYHGGFRVAAMPRQIDDSDGDGVSDDQERVAGTDTNDSADALRLEARWLGSRLEVSFLARSAAGYGYMDPIRLYTLEASRDTASGQWETVPGYVGIAGSDTIVRYIRPASDAEALFFRLQVWIKAGVTPQPARGIETIDRFGNAAEAFEMAFVTIEDEGNGHDVNGYPYPLGGVGYAYRIGKYEVSEEQVGKANVAGALGIVASNRGPRYPATLVDFVERARFVNWLNTSQGYPPAYNLDGAGVWRLWAVEDAWDRDGLNLYRHKDAMYFLPSADEWYKAAFFDGNRYFRYPTTSDLQPMGVAWGRVGGTVVYAQPVEAGPAPVDEAGGLSHYGTMGQGGNVSEWLETALDGVNDVVGELLQQRGGVWSSTRTGIWAQGANSGRPTGGGGSPTAGFRVAARLVGTAGGEPEDWGEASGAEGAE